MHQKNVLITGRSRRYEVGLFCDASGEQAVVNALVFFGRKDMGADREVVVVAVDELEGEHGRFGCRPPILSSEQSKRERDIIRDRAASSSDDGQIHTIKTHSCSRTFTTNCHFWDPGAGRSP